MFLGKVLAASTGPDLQFHLSLWRLAHQAFLCTSTSLVDPKTTNQYSSRFCPFSLPLHHPTTKTTRLLHNDSCCNNPHSFFNTIIPAFPTKLVCISMSISLCLAAYHPLAHPCVVIAINNKGILAAQLPSQQRAHDASPTPKSQSRP